MQSRGDDDTSQAFPDCDDAHTLSPQQIFERFNVDGLSGLAEAEVVARRNRFGLNELIERGQRTALRILGEQLSGAMVFLLFGAAAVSLLLREYIDATAILTIIVLNAILGFVQDFRAERSLAALRKLAVPHVRVRREGVVVDIVATQLVPGDVVLIEAGNAVPADCRLIESFGLKAQEAALTGESEAIEKTIDVLPASTKLIADQTNMVWMGTILTYGHGTAIVVKTGMNTQLGQIASSLQSVATEQTPLQQRLAKLGRSLAVLAVAIVAIVFLFGLLRGEDAKLMLMTALSLAVAVVPEGLPAVATVALAIGARRMVQKQALIRKLPAVETLGSVTVICSDKTGTLTQNRMTAAILEVAGQQVVLNSESTRSADVVAQEIPKDESAVELLLTAASLCNDAELSEAADDSQNWQAAGEPTETALIIAAAQQGLGRSSLDTVFPRFLEVPFDSDRKMMTTLHRICPAQMEAAKWRSRLKAFHHLHESDVVAFTKGAADRVIARCGYAWSVDAPTELTDEWRQRIDNAGNQLAASGMRVLGFAMRLLDDASASDSLDSVEQDLIFLGLIGLIDPPRPEAREAVARCRSAGIRPVMITGDHPLTALHIAQQLGIADADSIVVTGMELDGAGPLELQPLVDRTSVYARVSPTDKLNIVRTLQDRGNVVAMTGDGVNDAPALKQAHIGVAMGIVGTDVSKEASDMILLDDNFATIVNAVEQGRIVYDNIRKFVKYTMTSNAGEVGVMLLGPLVGMPLALLPLQILWINLVTDGLPGLALALEPAERETMNRSPFPLQENVINRRMVIDIAWIGLLMAVVSLAMGYWYWSSGASTTEHWRTMVFTVLTLSQMGNALAIRSETDSLFRIGLFTNRALLGAVLLTFFMQLAVVYLPALQNIFRTTALNATELFSCLALSSVVFVAVELRKHIRRIRRA